MNRRRLAKINELIKQELGEIILRELKFPENTLVTITRVESTENLSEAKVYISTIPEDYSPKTLGILNKHIYKTQQLLNKKIKIRIVPKIRFITEEKTEKAEKIERLLEEIKRNG